MPLVIRTDREIEPPADPGGPLVGVWRDAEFTERTYELEDGDVVVAYTDGLLEAHAPERILAPEDLAVLAAECQRQSLGLFLRALEGAAVGSSIEPVRDDIAVLALAVQPVPWREEAGAHVPGSTSSRPAGPSTGGDEEPAANGDTEPAEDGEPTAVFALAP